MPPGCDWMATPLQTYTKSLTISLKWERNSENNSSFVCPKNPVTWHRLPTYTGIRKSSYTSRNSSHGRLACRPILYGEAQASERKTNKQRNKCAHPQMWNGASIWSVGTASKGGPMVWVYRLTFSAVQKRQMKTSLSNSPSSGDWYPLVSLGCQPDSCTWWEERKLRREGFARILWLTSPIETTERPIGVANAN